jgi:hypothetical protein
MFYHFVVSRVMNRSMNIVNVRKVPLLFSSTVTSSSNFVFADAYLYRTIYGVDVIYVGFMLSTLSNNEQHVSLYAHTFY